MKSKKHRLRQGSSKVRRSRSSLVVSLLIASVLFVFATLFVFEVANNRAEVRSNREALASAKEELRLLNAENEQLDRYSRNENLDEYLDGYARDVMGYVDPHERVFHIKPGD